HSFVLEPERFNERVALQPELAPDGEKWDRRKPHHKAAWAEFERTVAELGQEDISWDQARLMADMRMALNRCEKAAWLLFSDSDVPNESTIHWTCPQTGLQCKSRRDRVLILPGGKHLI